ncbi:MAG: hypothetical protein K1X64_15435 [Myxococcaceae bacterium]|nr:hypothetical protein [Myxococcaceae bacterium]
MRSVAFMAFSLLAMACGGTAKIGGGKAGAAQAFLNASEPTQNTSGVNLGSSLFGDLAVPCDHGGDIRLKNLSLDVSAGNGGASTGIGFTAQFFNCKSATSDAGDAVLNGELTVNNLTKASSQGALLQQTLKGKLTVGGAFNDFLDADVVQELSVSTMGGPQISATVKGQIATSSDSFTFDERVLVTADKIVVDVSTK